jgi:hypothetical protein
VRLCRTLTDDVKKKKNQLFCLTVSIYQKMREEKKRATLPAAAPARQTGGRVWHISIWRIEKPFVRNIGFGVHSRLRPNQSVTNIDYR